MTCKGLIYKFSSDHIYNYNGDIVLSSKLQIITEKSCPGCKGCDMLRKAIPEELNAWLRPITNLRFAEIGKEYRLVFTPTWELALECQD